MNLALNGLPEFTRYAGRARPAASRHHAHLPPIDYIERAWDDAKYGRPPIVRCSN